MKDSTGKLVQGRTRWRRFLILLGPALAMVSVMMYMVAAGAAPLTLAISGMPFRLHATTLNGDNFIQYATPTAVTNPAAGALVAGELAGVGIPSNGAPNQAGTSGQYLADTITLLQNAKIDGLHQTVCAPMPNIFGFSIPDLQVTIDASGQATAPVLTVQAPGLAAASATFTNIIIGEDTGQAIVGYGYAGAPPPLTTGLFSQAADHVTISTLDQIAVGTEAGSFTLPGLTLSAGFVSSCP